MLRATCCVICGNPLPAGGRLDRRYCRKSCRAVAYRAGKRDPLSRPAQRTAPPGDAEVERSLLYTKIPREVLDVLARHFGQQRERMAAELADARQRVAELDKVIAADPAKATAVLDAPRTLEAEMAQLNAELVATRSTLTTQLETAQRHQRELAATLRDVTNERDKALRDLSVEAERVAAWERKDAEQAAAQARASELATENARHQETALVRRDAHDMALSEATQRAQTLEQRLALRDAEAEAAERQLAKQSGLIAAMTKKLQNMRMSGRDGSDSLVGSKEAREELAELRREVGRLRNTVSARTAERDEAREEIQALSKKLKQAVKKKTGAKSDEPEGKLKRALAEREAALFEAHSTRVEMDKREALLAEKARHIVETLERSRVPQNTLTVAAHRYEGPYDPAKDRLYRITLEELMQTAELARQQYIQSKPQTARTLNPHLTPQQQAYALAMAARWWLFADPPKSYKKKVSWQHGGYVLDAEAELFLFKQSNERRADAWWRELWLKPPERKRRKR